MMRRFLCGATALTLLTATLAWAGGEQKKKKITIPAVPAKQAAEAPAEPDATTLAVETLAAAQTLADVGRETKAPELLIAAARVIGKANYGKLDTQDAKIESEAKELTPAQEAEALIAEALELGGPNAAAIKTLAASLREDLKEATRGAVGGPKSRTGFVDAKYDKTDTFFVTFQGGRLAHVHLTNLRNRGDLDLYVYTLDNKLVRRDYRKNASAHVSFVPPSTSRFRIVVKAYKGPSAIHYRLSTN